jgi:1-aminocyclopropane-1-carboxylate deaminase/D-cysteine desulfhydrase-like pyridoxal-dependent ACC family enzyme
MGLEAHLFYFEKRPPELRGNLLLCNLFGARMHFIPLGTGSDGNMRIETTDFLVRALSLLWPGPGAYFIPVGGHNVTGCLGYVEAALEINEQITAAGLSHEKVTLVIPCGTGGTLAGLMAGFRLLDSPVRLLGIDVGRLWKGFPASVASLSSKLCQALGQPVSFSAFDVPLIEFIYAGAGYAVYSDPVGAAIRSLAQSEGILLDPVYTGKAFAGMLDLAAKGHFAADSHLIFLHTGGLPGLWAYADQLAS